MLVSKICSYMVDAPVACSVPFDYLFMLWVRAHMPALLPSTCAELGLTELGVWPPTAARDGIASEHRAGSGGVPVLGGAALLTIVQHWLLWMSRPTPRMRCVHAFVCGRPALLRLTHAVLGHCLETRDSAAVPLRRGEELVEGVFTAVVAKKEIMLLYRTALAELRPRQPPSARLTVAHSTPPAFARPSLVEECVPRGSEALPAAGLGPANGSAASPSPAHRPPTPLAVPASGTTHPSGDGPASKDGGDQPRPRDSFGSLVAPEPSGVVKRGQSVAHPETQSRPAAISSPSTPRSKFSATFWATERDFEVEASGLMRYFAAVLAMPPTLPDAAALVSVCEHIIAFLQTCLMNHLQSLDHGEFFRTFINILSARLVPGSVSSPQMRLICKTLFIGCVRMCVVRPLTRESWSRLSSRISKLTFSEDLLAEWSQTVLACTQGLTAAYSRHTAARDHDDSVNPQRHTSLSIIAHRPRISLAMRKGGDDLELGSPLAPRGREGHRPSPGQSRVPGARGTAELPRVGEDPQTAECRDIDVRFSCVEKLAFSSSEAVLQCWENMLGLLGDVAAITPPGNQMMALRALEEVYTNVRSFAATPYVPHFAPWILGTLQRCGPGDSRRVAFRMLCQFALHSTEPPPRLLVLHFYTVLLGALRDYCHTDLLYDALSNCSTLFCRTLPGSSLLMLDVVAAVRAVLGHGYHRPMSTACVLSAEHLKGAPRIAAISLFCSIICFTATHMTMQQPSIRDISRLCPQPLLFDEVPEFPRLALVSRRSPVRLLLLLFSSFSQSDVLV